MNGQDVLNWIKPKISNDYYDTLFFWIKSREKFFLFFDTSFDIEPTIFYPGYTVWDRTRIEFMIVYKD